MTQSYDDNIKSLSDVKTVKVPENIHKKKKHIDVICSILPDKNDDSSSSSSDSMISDSKEKTDGLKGGYGSYSSSSDEYTSEEGSISEEGSMYGGGDDDLKFNPQNVLDKYFLSKSGDNIIDVFNNVLIVLNRMDSKLDIITQSLSKSYSDSLRPRPSSSRS